MERLYTLKFTQTKDPEVMLEAYRKAKELTKGDKLPTAGKIVEVLQADGDIRALNTIKKDIMNSGLFRVVEGGGYNKADGLEYIDDESE